MAVVTETIGSGKDRATVTLWEANVGVFGTDTYEGLVQESVNFDENVTLTGSTGTPSITSYLHLTSDPANRHAGVAGTGHARMYGTGASHIITCDASFTRVSWLDIKQDQAGSSDEGIRVNAGCDDVLIQYCIIWTDSDGSVQDGIYTGDYDLSRLRVDDCILYGWRRAGLHVQQFSAGNPHTITLDVDHCAFDDCGVTSELESGAIYIRSRNGSDAITIGLFNTYGARTRNSHAPFVDGDAEAQPSSPNGSVIWNGSNNGRDDTTDHIGGTDNTTAWEDATDGIVATTKSTGSWVVVTSLTGGSEDLTLLDDEAGNLMAGNGVNRQGSEPDARQDFSVAIDGPRPTTGVDIGASQVSTAGDATATPSALAITTTFDATTQTASADATTTALAVTATFDGAAVAADSLVTATALTINSTFDGVVAVADSLVTAAALSVAATFDGVAVTADSLVTGTALPITTTFDQPIVFADAPVSPAALVVAVTLDPVTATGDGGEIGAIIIENA